MAEGNPPFGSPAWRAKYGKKSATPSGAPSPSATVAAIRNKIEPASRGKGGRRRQPIGELARAISALESAIAVEPEPVDKETLEGCLRSMKVIQGKNESEERPGG